MVIKRHEVGLAEPLLRHLARWLLERAPRAGRGDLTGILILLPAVRACAGLQHALLEESGRDALLLPDILTPEQLESRLAARLGLGDEGIPPARLRAVLLASRLAGLPWLAEFPASAPGLAEELVALFDEIRRNYLAGELLGDRGGPHPAELAGEPARRIFHQDLSRIREAWRLYRQVVPRDRTDRLLAVIQEVEKGTWPGPGWDLAVAAGFSDLDRATAALLRLALDQAEAHLFEPGATDPLSRLFLLTYSDLASEVHPLRLARKAAAVLAGPAPTAAEAAAPAGATSAAAHPFRERLRALEPELARLADGPAVEMLACGDPEHESRTVAAVVGAELERRAAGGGACGERPPRIAVATADLELARRIVAQLRDAGIEVDDTAGVPLSQRPAGLLAGLILQTAVTGFGHRPLLELLIHPFVSLGPEPEEHPLWTLRFEKMIRGGQRPLTGLAGYRRRAAEWDAHARRSARPRAGRMTAFVEAVGRALVPLSDLGTGPRSWDDLLAALAGAWEAVAPGRALDPASPQEDEAALAGLIAELTETADRLPPTTLEDFAATLQRLIAARTVRPHRPRFLPVRVTGLIEARLESYDLLVLAGMSEEVFPGRLPRPVFLTDAARQAAGLPGWRDGMVLRSELFLRLLHNAGTVVVTWPAERLGQPSLPSPFVIRLGMSGFLGCTWARAEPLLRTEAPPLADVASDQARFRAEPPAIPARPGSRKLAKLSHKALQSYRVCPYRFLLERGFGLKEEEEVIEAFRRLDHGNLVHECMRRFLAPGGRGQAALTAGDLAAAQAVLIETAVTVFGEGAETLPQRLLWAEGFAGTARSVVEFESERFAAGWRPAVLEGSFALDLGRIRDWLVAAGEAEPLPLDEDAAGFPLEGKIDRIDVLGEGPSVAVIDYKTGLAPPARAVAEGEDLQIVLYALAVEAGQVGDSEQHLTPGVAWQVAEGAYYRFDRKGSGFGRQRPHLEGSSPEGRQVLRRGGMEIIRAALAARDRGRPYPLVPEHWREPQPGRLPCSICPFDAICRLEERDRPSHLEVKFTRELTATWRG